MNKNTTTTLNNGTEIPVLGLGVYGADDGPEVEQSIAWALEAGYRMIDTAKMYNNEGGVGNAVRNASVPREELFVTTKLWASDQGYKNTLRAFDDSLSRLGLEYVDLYLIHWPGGMGVESSPRQRGETWKAFEEINKSGKAKAIGVANYTIRHLEEMKAYAHVEPAVNQVEFHPFLYQKELLDYCREKNIVMEAYCPLVRARAMEHGKSSAQVLIRWSLQHGLVPIPKSVRKERIEENIDVFDFELSDTEMEQLNNLSNETRITWDPEEVQ